MPDCSCLGEECQERCDDCCWKLEKCWGRCLYRIYRSALGYCARGLLHPKGPPHSTALCGVRRLLPTPRLGGGGGVGRHMSVASFDDCVTTATMFVARTSTGGVVVPVPMFQDNYAYAVVCERTGKCAVIDPGDHKPVVSLIRSLQAAHPALEVTHVLLTHYHYDHGVEHEKFCAALLAPAPLSDSSTGKATGHSVSASAVSSGHRSGGQSDGPAQRHRPAVVGSRIDFPDVDTHVDHGDSLNVGDLLFEVVAAPGHTTGHVMFVASVTQPPGPSEPTSGPGDAAGGCLEPACVDAHREPGRRSPLREPSTRTSGSRHPSAHSPERQVRVLGPIGRRARPTCGGHGDNGAVSDGSAGVRSRPAEASEADSRVATPGSFVSPDAVRHSPLGPSPAGPSVMSRSGMQATPVLKTAYDPHSVQHTGDGLHSPPPRHLDPSAALCMPTLVADAPPGAGGAGHARVPGAGGLGACSTAGMPGTHEGPLATVGGGAAVALEPDISVSQLPPSASVAWYGEDGQRGQAGTVVRPVQPLGGPPPAVDFLELAETLNSCTQLHVEGKVDLSPDDSGGAVSRWHSRKQLTGVDGRAGERLVKPKRRRGSIRGGAMAAHGTYRSRSVMEHQQSRRRASTRSSRRPSVAAASLAGRSVAESFTGPEQTVFQRAAANATLQARVDEGAREQLYIDRFRAGMRDAAAAATAGGGAYRALFSGDVLFCGLFGHFFEMRTGRDILDTYDRLWDLLDATPARGELLLYPGHDSGPSFYEEVEERFSPTDGTEPLVPAHVVDVYNRRVATARYLAAKGCSTVPSYMSVEALINPLLAIPREEIHSLRHCSDNDLLEAIVYNGAFDDQDSQVVPA